MEQPLHTFKVIPGSSRGLFFRVKVFRTKTALQTYLRVQGHGFDRRCIGMCATQRRVRVRTGTRQRTQMDMGEILLCVPHLGAGVVSHEATHAALAWGRRLGGLDKMLSPDQPTTRGHTLTPNSPEEAFCYGVSAITRQIYAGLHTRRVV